MIEYKFIIRNPEKCEKRVFVSGENFHEAVRKMKCEFGHEWVVVDSVILNAQY